MNVTEAYMDKKLAALQAYESQIEKNRGYFEAEFIKGIARVRGIEVSEKLSTRLTYRHIPWSEGFYVFS